MASKVQYLLRISAPRFGVSVFSGAIFYLAWMSLSLSTRPWHTPLIRGVLWVIAPLITGLGFSLGAAGVNRLRHLPPLPFHRHFGYSLACCGIGAAAVFPFGPMLIVFGMCLMGSLAALVFEVVSYSRLTPSAPESDPANPMSAR